jgi:hypothetical protein
MVALAWVLQACTPEVVPPMNGAKRWVGDRYAASADAEERRAFRERVEDHWQEEARRAAERKEAGERGAAEPPPPSGGESCSRSGRSPNPDFIRWQEERDALGAELKAIQTQIARHRAGAPQVETETVETQSTYRTSDDVRRGERGTTVVGRIRRETGASAGRRAASAYELDRLSEEEERVISRIQQLPSPPPRCSW